jgi:thymidylate synthase
MKQYLHLAKRILEQDDLVPTRAKIDDKNISAYSLFGEQLVFNLNSFPLLTTKKLSFKNIVHELIWFLRGDTSIEYLLDNGVNIWNEWANSNG